METLPQKHLISMHIDEPEGLKGRGTALLRSVCFAVLFFALFCNAGLCAQPAVASEPPVIPVGLDAYRQWDRWPLQRIGARAYMRSTYDRTGGNRSADASH